MWSFGHSSFPQTVTFTIRKIFLVRLACPLLDIQKDSKAAKGSEKGDKVVRNTEWLLYDEKW